MNKQNGDDQVQLSHSRLDVAGDIESLHKMLLQLKNTMRRFESSSLTKEERERVDDLTQSQLCEECLRIFNKAHPDEWFAKAHPHHSLRSLLEEAVKEGCTLCVWINTALGHDVNWDDELHGYGEDRIIGLSFKLGLDTTGDRFEFFLNGMPIIDLQMVNHENIESQITRSKLPSNTKSKQSWSLIRQWLSDCRQHHYRCDSATGPSNSRPSRLLYLRKFGDAICARLEDHMKQRFEIRYLTLSHCWGKQKIFQLTTDMLPQLRKVVPIQLLPQVFQDAMEVTIELGYEYLWIDSLCICQDSLEDWLNESSNMASIYQNAECNIAATGFSDGQNGLFVQRDPETMYPRKILTKWAGEWAEGYPRRQLFYVVNDRMWEDGVTNAPLNKRGWVLQERLLSPRTIHFGNGMIFWECCQTSCCEVYPYGVPRDILAKKVKAPSPPKADGLDLQDQSHSDDISDVQRIYETWHTTVAAYSMGKLTRTSDRTIAISGAAKYFRHILQDEYLAGLWRRNLLQDLLWSISHSSEVILYSNWMAPSWSWLSIDSQIQYYDGQYGIDTPPNIEHATIIDAGITPDGDDVTGPLRAGYVTIEGHLTLLSTIPGEMVGYRWLIDEEAIRPNITFDIQGTGPGTGTRKHGSISVTTPEAEHYSIATYDWLAATLLARRPIYVLPLLTDIDWELDLPYMRGLVLGHCDGIKGHFVRIGYFEAKSDEEQRILLKQHKQLSEELYLESDGVSLYTISIV